MVAITVVQDDVETLFVQVQLTGLTAGTRYDVHRLQQRYLGDDDTGTPVYERELPDRLALWSSVAHRVGWQATASGHTFRDYECPMRPTRYFVVLTSAGGPTEWDFGDGTYPVSRGVLSSEVVHFNRDLEEAGLDLEPQEGRVLVRSTDELGLYVAPCLVEMEGPVYTARGTEHAVMGTQFPVYVSDTREARRGTLTLLTRDLGQYNDLRRIAYPASGIMRPIVLQGGGDAAILLDDMRCLPLDVESEQATPSDADARYVHIDYLEIDPSVPLVARSGDNDSLVTPPVAQFTISDTTPNVGQWVTLTDTSTGSLNSWEWTVEDARDNRVGKWYTQGPHKVRWRSRGRKTIKLRVYGTAGAHTRTKTVRVG
jgi:hypothetical protein